MDQIISWEVTAGETEENPQQVSEFRVEITATLFGGATNHSTMFLPLNATPHSCQDVVDTLVSVGITRQLGAEALANDILVFCRRTAVGVQVHGLVLLVLVSASVDSGSDGAENTEYLAYLEAMHNADGSVPRVPLSAPLDSGRDGAENIEYLAYLETMNNGDDSVPRVPLSAPLDSGRDGAENIEYLAYLGLEAMHNADGSVPCVPLSAPLDSGRDGDENIEYLAYLGLEAMHNADGSVPRVPLSAPLDSGSDHAAAEYIAHLAELEEMYNADVSIPRVPVRALADSNNEEEEEEEEYDMDALLDARGNVAASAVEFGQLERVRIGDKERTCSICLGNFPAGSEATRLPCSHHFHGDCICTWLKKSKTCPYCRLKLPT